MACEAGACVLSTGLNGACTNRAAGGNVSKIYLISRCEVEDIQSYGYASDTVVTGITLAPGATWKRVSCLRNTVNVTQEVVENSLAITQTVAFSIGKFGDDLDKVAAAAQVIDFLEELTSQDEGLIAAVEDNNGVFYLFGEDSGLFIAAPSTSTSGTTFTEAATTAVTLVGGNSRRARVLAADVVLTV